MKNELYVTHVYEFQVLTQKICPLQAKRAKVVFDAAVVTELTLEQVFTATRLEQTPTLWHSTRFS